MGLLQKTGYGAKGWRKKVASVLSLTTMCFAWTLLWPITWLVPRRKDVVLVYGRDGGKFLDNCKHFYCALAERAGGDGSPFRILYVVDSLEVAREVVSCGGNALVYGPFRLLPTWLRAGTIVVDSVDWRKGGRHPASRGARVVQLWHGIPLKHIQRKRAGQRMKDLAILHRAYASLSFIVKGGGSRVDVLASPSRYVTKMAFADSFNYKEVVNAGYPRNDALFHAGGPLRRINVDEAAALAIRQHRLAHSRGRVLLYAPTYREGLADPFETGTIDLDRLSRVASELELLVLVKLHPWMSGRVHTKGLDHIRMLRSDSDAYPLLRDIDLLMTDYSSIFFDFLLLGKPILFYPYDLEAYVAERAMYFDYATMAPGPQARDMEGVERMLRDAVAGIDRHFVERDELCGRLFDHRDGASADRLASHLFGRQWDCLK